MPELPEVETTRRGIAPVLTGGRLRGAVVRDRRLRWPVPTNLDALLRGRRVRAVERRAKYLLLRLDSEADLIVHLGMSGSLRLVPAAQLPGKHDHVDLLLAAGMALRLTDPRRFGAILWAAQGAEQHPLFAHLGVEPLTDAFTGAYLHARARRLRAPVKNFLMDAHVVVGIGNIYANEALFRAGVRPATAAGRIGLRRYERIATAAAATLAAAVTAGGTTLRDFAAADGRPGYFGQELLVYGRAGQPCRHCGAPLVGTRLGGRSTFHCRRCQR